MSGLVGWLGLMGGPDDLNLLGCVNLVELS